MASGENYDAQMFFGASDDSAVTAILEAAKENQPSSSSPNTQQSTEVPPQAPAGNTNTSSTKSSAEANAIQIPPFVLEVDETPKPRQPAPLSTPALARRIISSSILYSPQPMSPMTPAINLFGARFAAMASSPAPAPTMSVSVTGPGGISETDIVAQTPSRVSPSQTEASQPPAAPQEMAAPKRPATRVRSSHPSLLCP
jgi:hypothetical protein